MARQPLIGSAARQRTCLTAWRQNAVLSALGETPFSAQPERLERFSFGHGDLFVMKGLAVEDVIFPISGMISLVTLMEDGSSVEFASVGREGVIGLGGLLGTGWGTGNAVGQIPGDAIRVESDLVLSAIDQDRHFRHRLHRYVHAFIVMIAQNVACSRLHTMEERAAKWLLLTRDRIQSLELQLTHEGFAEMLGVHRPSLTQAVHSLSKRGVAEFSRGRCVLTDVPGLQSLACECYGVIRQEFDRVGEG